MGCWDKEREETGPQLEDEAKVPTRQIPRRRAKEETVAKEAVNHPSHYGGGDNPYEVIKVLRAWGITDFWLGNVIKYVARAGKKGQLLEDLKKARWYLDDYIKDLEEKQS